MKGRQFWADLTERAIKTFAQALLGAFAAGVTVVSLEWGEALAVAATAALLSILTSVVSSGVGDHESASAVPRYVGKHRVEE